MKKNVVLIAVIFILLLIIGALIAFLLPSNQALAPTKTGGEATSTPPANQTAGISDLISVSAPLIHAAVSSPLAVSGQARGTWYFEAVFPIELKDASGNVIAQSQGHAQSDWMTTEFVPFTASLTFPAQPSGSKGTLVLKKDNPSGDPNKDQSVEIPVVFK